MSPHSKSWFFLQIDLAVVSYVVLNSLCLLLFILSLHFIPQCSSLFSVICTIRLQQWWMLKLNMPKVSNNKVTICAESKPKHQDSDCSNCLFWIWLLLLCLVNVNERGLVTQLKLLVSDDDWSERLQAAENRRELRVIYNCNMQTPLIEFGNKKFKV